MERQREQNQAWGAHSAPRLGRLFAACLVFVAVPLSAGEGVARQVAELETGQQETFCDADGAFTWNEEAFLSLTGACGGAEPWLSDGTTAGTRRLRDLLPGDGGTDPIAVGKAGGLLYFTAEIPGRGREPVRTDGTSTGTWLLGDLRPGPLGSDVIGLGALEGDFYFSARDGVSGRELWRSDGTPSGTRRVRDIRPGSQNGIPEPEAAALRPYAAAVGGFLLFAASDGPDGVELWRTDGTEAGTTLLLDIDIGPGGSLPEGFSAGPGGVYFRATKPAWGSELWISDGTAGGTKLLRNVAPGTASSNPVPLGVAGGRMLFAATDPEHGREIWRSDGTSSGTALLRDIWVGASSSDPRPGAVIDGRVIFAADDGIHGREPWRSDGTAGGTLLVKDLSASGGSTWFETVAANDSWLFFDAYDSGAVVGRTNGTAGGTRLGPVLNSSQETWWTAFAAAGDHAVVGICGDDCGPCPTYCATYTTDATEAGTEILWPMTIFDDASPARFTPRASEALFVALEDRRLYRTDGSSPGTMPVLRNGSPAQWVSDFSTLDDGEYLFAASSADSYRHLWRTTPGSFEVICSFYPTIHRGILGDELVRIAERHYFRVLDDWEIQIWNADGTGPGCSMLVNLETSTTLYGRGEFTGVDDSTWFVGATDEHGVELWQSGGTPASTIVHDLVPGSEPFYEGPSDLTSFPQIPGSLLFRRNRQLLRWDSATQAAILLHTISFDVDPYRERFPFAILGDRALFFDLEANGVCALWATDGSPAGTVRVRETGSGSMGSAGCPQEMARLPGGSWHFAACSPAAGCELWRTDGTPEGTAMLIDTQAGALSSSPSSLTVLGDRLYFSACTSSHGCEPWVTDGSVAGTHRLGDLSPGDASSNPTEFALVGDKVYFAADGGAGSEPWVMPGELFYDGFQTGDTTRWSVGP